MPGFLLSDFDEALKYQFWSLVEKRGDDDCWHWLWSTSNGYGVFNARGKNGRAHRLSLMLHVARDLTREELACHHCDNPPCVNPKHLYAGSSADNSRDKMERGRFVPYTRDESAVNYQRGQSHGRAKIKEADIPVIMARKANGESGAKIAIDYGVERSSILAITRGQLWTHIPRTPIRGK